MRLRFGLLLALLTAGASAGPEERDLILKNLDRLRACGDLERAVENASAACDRFPTDLSIHTRYQDLRRSLGQEAQVREEYRRRWSTDKSVHSMCLYARLLKGRAAIREYKQALRLEPDYFWAHYGIGVAYMREGDLASARHHLEMAHSIQPHHPAPKIRLGQAAERRGDFAAGLEYYELAAEVAPDVPDPLFHQVFALIALKRQDEARKRATMLRAHPAPDAAAMGEIALGILCAGSADNASAADHFRAAVEQSGRFGTHALCFLGDTLTDLGRDDEAQTAYDGALERDPGNVRALMGLGYLDYRRARFEEADEAFAKAEKRARKIGKRGTAQPLFFRGVVAEERGKLRHALRFYLDATRSDPDLPEYQLALAVLYERMKQPKKARKAYLEASRLDPTDALPCFQAGLIDAELKHGTQALDQFREAVKRDADLLDAYLAAGSVCQDLLDRPNDAKAWYHRYLARGGKDERVRGWLAELD